MLLPSTTPSALFTLFVACVCLGSWANLFKASRWRYEFFYLDFALGALALAVLGAYTFGTLGPDMSFADRMVVAGNRSQVLACAAGFIFGLGNLLLLAAAALRGMTLAFPFTFSLAFLVVAAIELAGAPSLGASSILLLYLVSFVSLVFAAVRGHAIPAKKSPPTRPNVAIPLKVIALCVLGGLLIGASVPLGSLAFWGDLGLGAYAGSFFFCIGLAVATALFNIFFMNMGLVGGRVRLPDYKQGTLKQHSFGILAGSVWAAGFLTELLAHSTTEPLPSWSLWLERGWVLLAAGWGWLTWKETHSMKSARLPLLVGLVSFTAAVAVGSVVQH